MNKINNNMSFQEAFEALSETVAKLEDPKIKIDESLALYEQACKLVVFCQRRLNETKMKITDINEHIAAMRKSGEPLFED